MIRKLNLLLAAGEIFSCPLTHIVSDMRGKWQCFIIGDGSKGECLAIVIDAPENPHGFTSGNAIINDFNDRVEGSLHRFYANRQVGVIDFSTPFSDYWIRVLTKHAEPESKDRIIIRTDKFVCGDPVSFFVYRRADGTDPVLFCELIKQWWVSVSDGGELSDLGSWSGQDNYGHMVGRLFSISSSRVAKTSLPWIKLYAIFRGRKSRERASLRFYFNVDRSVDADRFTHANKIIKFPIDKCDL